MPEFFERIIRARVFGRELPDQLVIEPIGPDWTAFAGSSDRARYVPSSIVSGSVVDYEACEGSLFPAHVHDRREEGHVLGGPITVRDADGNPVLTLKTGDTFSFEAEEPHEFLFHGAAMLRLRYTPAFEVSPEGLLLWTAFRPPAKG